MNKYLKYFFYLISICFMLYSAALAQVGVPTNLVAKPTEDGRILLEWKKPLNSQVDYFKVYRSSEDTFFATMISVVPGDRESYLDYGLINGVKYNYYITAIRGFEGSASSNRVSAKTISGASRIQISSVAVTATETARLYQYKVSALCTDPSATVKYKLLFAPQGMIIYPDGMIYWIPLNAGRYDIKVSAQNITDTVYLNYGLMAQTIQKFSLQVATKTGTIQGRIVDESNKGIGGVVLRFYEVNNDEFTYDVRTDAYGNYILDQISAGDYYVYAKAPDGYESLWFPNSKDYSTSTLVFLSEGKSSTVNFSLKPKSFFNSTVSGRVVDTNGYPVSNAAVYFVDASTYLNSGQDDRSIDIFIEEFRDYISHSVLTDENGYYKISVTGNKLFYVISKKSGYNLTYYNNVNNILYAAKLRAGTQESIINFTLTPQIASQNRIEGKVVSSDIGEGLQSRIILMKRPRGGGGGRVPFKFDVSPLYKTFNTDIYGKFVIENVDTNLYTIQAIPFGSYLPVYYSSDTTSNSVKWTYADSINTIGSATGIIIKSLPAITDGIGSVNGRVVSSLGGGVAGALVYAFNDDKVVAYGITDSLGFYLIKGLRSNAYSIYVDKFDYQNSGPKYVQVINNQNPDIRLSDIILNPITTSILRTELGEIPTNNYMLFQNYPNPFNPSTTIEYKLERDANVELKVFDVLGRLVSTLSDQIQSAGVYRVYFNGSNLSSGAYFVSLRVYHNSQTVYFEKKKMLLTK